MARRVLGMAAAALLGLLSACATRVQLTTAWANPDFVGRPFGRVLVVGETADGATRRAFEDSFAAALNAQGVQAYPAYTVLPGSAGPPDADALRQAAAKLGADGVLTTRLLRVEQKTRTSPGYVRTVPVYGYRGGFYGYYGAWRTSYATYVQPPTVTVYDVAELQTDLWSLSGEDALAWSATSQAVAPTDASRTASALAGVVAEDLRSAGLIGGAGR